MPAAQARRADTVTDSSLVPFVSDIPAGFEQVDDGFCGSCSAQILALQDRVKASPREIIFTVSIQWLSLFKPMPSVSFLP
jgi:hypothetical protein